MKTGGDIGGVKMMQRKSKGSSGGFTLIELMIVIAIIGILAAIAIPNFIAYRNKSFCSAAQSDADTILAAVADYFAIPANSTVSLASLSGANAANKIYVNTLLSNQTHGLSAPPIRPRSSPFRSRIYPDAAPPIIRVP